MNITFSRALSSLVIGAMLLLACKKSSNQQDGPSHGTQVALSAAVQADADLSLFAAALSKAGLMNVLTTAGPYTVFAPTNQAFHTYLTVTSDADALTAIQALDTASLANLLKYHVVLGSNHVVDLPSSGALKPISTNSPAELLIHSVAGKVKVNTATITNQDIISQNGVIQKVDQVLTPGRQDLVDLASSKGINLFIVALNKAILSGILHAPGPYTLFAPSDAAFINYLQTNGYPAVIDQATAVQALANLTPAELTYKLLPVLQNHVLAFGRITYTPEVTDSISFPTLSPGVNVTLKKSGSVLSVGVPGGPPAAVVTTGDLQATNGILHLVDKVMGASLTAPTILYRVASDPELTNLAALITRTNLAPILSGNNPITFFAPTNAAIRTFFNVATDAAALSIINYLPGDSATAIIQYHTLGKKMALANLPADDSISTSLFAKGAIGGKMYVYKPTSSQVILNEVANVIIGDVGASNGLLHKIDGVVPPTNFDMGQTVLLQLLSKYPNLSVFVALMRKGGKGTSFVQARGPYTMFIPTDQAYYNFFKSNPAIRINIRNRCNCPVDLRGSLNGEYPLYVNTNNFVPNVEPIFVKLATAGTLAGIFPERKLSTGTFPSANDTVPITIVNGGPGNVTVVGRRGTPAKIISSNHFSATGVFHIIDNVIDFQKP